MKKVAILQSNYIPWKGYFDLIGSVDEFILFDEMQYTRRDWRNRNKIKTPNGLKWLTIPVSVKGKYLQTINATETEGTAWAKDHWLALSSNYRRAPHFEAVASWLAPLYEELSDTSLSRINERFLAETCERLAIDTPISRCEDYAMIDGKSERLAHLCAQAGGDVYVSGPAARDYLDLSPFEARGIAVEWFDYAGYPEYPQLWGPFVHGVTVLDLMFNCGADAPAFLHRE
ncbi:MAG TPA: WbqC family protein [Pseudorhizobium sp.]|jgi:hypothetical protein|nr:WbqC family protein [Pseudorhizobium sp.]